MTEYNCRLQNGLNPFCRIHIFKFLPTTDLLTLVKMNETHYHGEILDHVIASVWTTFIETRYSNAEELLCLFGKNMKKIRFIGARPKNIQQIENYCTPHRLTHLVLAFQNSYTMPIAISARLESMFSNLRELHYWCANKNLVTLFNAMTRIAVHMESLYLSIGVHVSGTSVNLNSNVFTQLKKFNCVIRRNKDMHFVHKLIEFLDTKSNLREFTFEGRLDIYKIYEILAQKCLQLQTFSDYNHHIIFNNNNTNDDDNNGNNKCLNHR